jgi:hypothetical protein
MKRGTLRMDAEQWAADCAKRERWQSASNQVNAGARAAVPDAPSPGAAPAPLSPVILLCGADGLPVPESEFYFAKPRRWRFDFAWPGRKLALEIEGGIWTQGRHTRGAGALADLEKYSEAAILGWRIIYTTPREVESGMVMDRVRRALA